MAGHMKFEVKIVPINTCTICGELSTTTDIQSLFMPKESGHVVSLELCADCRQELWRVFGDWKETDDYTNACLEWAANDFGTSKTMNLNRIRQKIEFGKRVAKSIIALRKRIFIWLDEEQDNYR